MQDRNEGSVGFKGVLGEKQLVIEKSVLQVINLKT